MSQEFDSDVSHLVKQKGFYAYNYMNSFEKLKEELVSKKKFYSLLTSKKFRAIDYGHALKFWDRFLDKLDYIVNQVIELWFTSYYARTKQIQF